MVISIIIYLTISSMFQIMMQTTGAVLMGLGQMKALVIHVFYWHCVKLAFTYILAPTFGIHGIITGTLMCFIVMTWLNMRVLKKDCELLGSRQ